MPETIHCRVKGCKATFRVKDFPDMMKKLRRHRKIHHPKAWRESVKKAQVTKKKMKQKGKKKSRK